MDHPDITGKEALSALSKAFNPGLEIGHIGADKVLEGMITRRLDLGVQEHLRES
jgi:hypothetical protein